MNTIVTGTPVPEGAEGSSTPPDNAGGNPEGTTVDSTSKAWDVNDDTHPDNITADSLPSFDPEMFYESEYNPNRISMDEVYSSMMFSGVPPSELPDKEKRAEYEKYLAANSGK